MRVRKKGYSSCWWRSSHGGSSGVFFFLPHTPTQKGPEKETREGGRPILIYILWKNQKAQAVAKEREAELRGKPYSDNYVLQQQIVKYSGDLRYQQRMIDDYPGYSDSVRPLVVDAIHRTPQNENTIAFFKNVILTEVNGSAVARASRHLLDALKVPQSTEAEKEKYRAMVAELRSDDTQRKLRMITKLERK